MKWLSTVCSWPWPISTATLLTSLSAVCLALAWLGAVDSHSLESVFKPISLPVLGLGIFLAVRGKRPESMVAAVPIPVLIIAPAAVALGFLSIDHDMDALPRLPATTPSGAPAHSLSVGFEKGTCVTVYNGTERVTEPPAFCEAHQIHQGRLTAAVMLLFSSVWLWLAWAIYGGPPVQRVPPDRRGLQSIPPPGPEGAVFTIPSRRAYLWLSVRAAFIAYLMVVGWRGFPLKAQLAGIPVWSLVFFLLSPAVSMRYHTIQAYTSARRTEPWLLPSWFLNPLQRSQPFQFFHLCSLGFLALGLSPLVRDVISGRLHSLGQAPPELFGAAFGLGILIGIYWAVYAYRSRFVRVRLA